MLIGLLLSDFNQPQNETFLFLSCVLCLCLNPKKCYLRNINLFVSSEIYVMMNLPEYSRTKCKDTPSLETPFADKTSLSRSTQNDENLLLDYAGKIELPAYAAIHCVILALRRVERVIVLSDLAI